METVGIGSRREMGSFECSAIQRRRRKREAKRVSIGNPLESSHANSESLVGFHCANLRLEISLFFSQLVTLALQSALTLSFLHLMLQFFLLSIQDNLYPY